MLATALLLIACTGDSVGGVRLVNDTSSSVRITEVLAGVEGASPSRLDDGHDVLAAGERATLILDSDGSSRCTSGEIVARTLDGQEVARFPPPVCAGDEFALSWAVDPDLEALLPGTIGDKAARRYTLRASSAKSGQMDVCSPCRMFTAEEIDGVAEALGVTTADMTLGLADWTSRAGDETVLLRAIKASAPQGVLLTTWIGVQKAKQPKTTADLATIERKQVTVLVDPTRATEWFATTYAYEKDGVLFLVSYSNSNDRPSTESSPPAVIGQVVGALP